MRRPFTSAKRVGVLTAEAGDMEGSGFVAKGPHAQTPPPRGALAARFKLPRERGSDYGDGTRRRLLYRGSATLDLRIGASEPEVDGGMEPRGTSSQPLTNP